MPQALTILVFDSGLGGLTVFREVIATRPDARLIYLADDAGFPYGDLIEERLVARVTDVLGKAIVEHKPDMVVVACNTASTLTLAQLRARFSVPFVGTVPAIKPACARSKSKRIAVLGTQATVGREYTKTLIREFAAGCDVHLVGSPRLAAYAEAELASEAVDDSAIKAEIAGCFVDTDTRRTDTIVLACTHYPLLLERFRANAPWPVDWLDPAPAIARRVANLLRGRPSTSTRTSKAIKFTSGRTPSLALARALTSFGF
ncbi:MAG TPA: glutamate racemase [Pseudolabrys sp.]|nr:glutamate racemase [Pseudolabrys sp.]